MKNRDFASARKTPQSRDSERLARARPDWSGFYHLKGCAAALAVVLPQRKSVASRASELDPALTAVPPTRLLRVTADGASVLRLRRNEKQ